MQTFQVHGLIWVVLVKARFKPVDDVIGMRSRENDMATWLLGPGSI